MIVLNIAVAACNCSCSTAKNFHFTERINFGVSFSGVNG